MASAVVAALSNMQRSEARIAVDKLVSLGLGRFVVEELDAELPAELDLEDEVWRNIRYGQKDDRRLQTFKEPSYSQPETGVSIPFGERLQAVEKKAQGDNLWLKLGNGTYANKWVLAKEGSTRNCVRLGEWKDHMGRIPDSAFSGQEFPTAGMYTEGYDGLAKDICLVSASGDAFWREVNIEMLFRDLATATVFEEQWGGDANFTDWVAYYSGNVLIFGHLRTPTPRRLVVTVKHTSRWKSYLRGCCYGPDVQAVTADIGKAQAKECQWLHSMRQRLDLNWEDVEFVTAFTFLAEYCGWSDHDCWQAAVHKLASLSSEWAQCMSYKKRSYLLGSAIWCLDEAFARQPAGTQLPASESVAILRLLRSLPQTYRLELMQKEPTDAMMRWIDVQSNTLALVAAECGWLEVLKVLQGTDPNLRNVRGDLGRTPIHLAARGGHVAVLRLLDRFRSQDLQDDQGQTPAHIAAECGQWNVLKACAVWVGGEKANEIVQAIQTQFQSLGEHEANAKAIAAAESGNVAALRNLNHFHSRLKEAKHCEAQARAAARSGQVEALQLFLVELGLDVNVQDSDGQSMAHDAASSGQPEILRLLLLHGANLSLQDHDGEVPAHRAASRGHVEALRVLADGSADLSARNKDSKTPALYAAKRNHKEALQLLAGERADLDLHDSSGSTVLHYAASKGHVEALEGLADSGADLNVCDGGGKTPTCCAAEGNQVGALRLLAHRGADMNVRDASSKAAVHYAAEYHNRVGALRLLAHKGADLNAQGINGNTALHLAALWGRVEALGVLAESGADLNARNGKGQTPAHQAAYGNKAECLRLLASSRADLTLKDNRGNTLEDMAKSGGAPSALRLLRELRAG